MIISLRGILYILIIAALFSCAHPNYSTSVHSATAETAKNDTGEINSEYILQEDDVLEIKFFYNPELNEHVPIRPDGKISLQLIDDVQAAGLSPLELDKILTRKYSVIFFKPEITVIVKKFASQKVYIGGEVAFPSLISLNENMTALQAILNAGGFRETAQPADIIVISRGANGIPVARAVDLQKVISGESPESDAYLKPYDIVFVPKSLIANVNKFVDQYIDKIVPDFISVGFSYSIYKGKQKGTVETIPAH